MKLAPVFEKLLEGWKAQGYELLSLAQMAACLDEATLPRCEMHRGEIPGRSGTLMEQQNAPGAAGEKERFTHLYNYPVPDCRFPDGAPGPADP